MKIISFYTKNTIYEKEIEDLSASCKALQIDHYIEAREDLGCWEKNCNQKPLFIYECMEKFKEPLIWVDADAIVLKKPDLPMGDADIGLYFNNVRTKHARNGTIYINPTKRAKDFMLVWYNELQKSTPLIPDQPMMISLLRKIPLKILKLPVQYVQVFDRDPIPLDQTVILHFQASRSRRLSPLFWQNLSGSELKSMRMNLSSHLDLR